MQEIIEKLKSVKLSILAHPDCEIDSEFEDMADTLDEVIGELSTDKRVYLADYIQRCVLQCGQMSYPSLVEAIKAYDDSINIGSSPVTPNFLTKEKNVFTKR